MEKEMEKETDETKVVKKIGAWKKEVKTKSGPVDIISFTMNGKRYTMWPNKFKKEKNHPDFQIIEDNYEPKEQSQSAPQQQYIPSVVTDKVIDNDLPF